MKLTNEQYDSITTAALAAFPNEFVGVCVDDVFITLTNVSDTPEDNFIVDPEEYEAAVDGGERICLIHSHPYDMNDNSTEARYIRMMNIDRRQPSKSDIVTAKAMGIEFGIVCTEGLTVSPILFFNSGDIADYEGRSFANYSADCWRLVHDYMSVEHPALSLPDPAREFNWWHDTPEDNFYAMLEDISELVEVDLRDIEHGDILLMSIDVEDDLLNHSAIYLNNKEHQASILHHMFSQNSCYNSYFRFANYVKKAYRYTPSETS